jgi:cephalosporin hydroxylase
MITMSRNDVQIIEFQPSHGGGALFYRLCIGRENGSKINCVIFELDCVIFKLIALFIR